jgi:hypothetical protein
MPSPHPTEPPDDMRAADEANGEPGALEEGSDAERPTEGRRAGEHQPREQRKDEGAR